MIYIITIQKYDDETVIRFYSSSRNPFEAHRLNGPAIELSNGIEGYWENGKLLRTSTKKK